MFLSVYAPQIHFRQGVFVSRIPIREWRVETSSPAREGRMTRPSERPGLTCILWASYARFSLRDTALQSEVPAYPCFVTES